MALDREAFIAAHKHLDLTEDKDGWGRPKFAHDGSSPVGWLAKTGQPSVSQHAAGQGGSERIYCISVFASRSSLDSDTIFCENYTPGYQPATERLLRVFVKELRAILSALRSGHEI